MADTLNEQQYAILDSVEDFGDGGATAADVAATVWITEDAARSAIRRMELRALLKRHRRGPNAGKAVFLVAGAGRRALKARAKLAKKPKRR